MSTFLLMDSLNAFFRAKHVVRGDTPEQKAAMALHVTFNIIRKAWEKFDADHVVFCLEGRSWRYEVYPQYKASRKTARAELTPEAQEEDKVFFAAFSEFAEFMREQTNVTILNHELAEADDMIARWIATHPDDDHVIVSSDGDFVQLIDHNVKIFNGVKGVTIDSRGVLNDKGKRVDFKVDNGGGIKVGKTLLKESDPMPVDEDWIEYALFTKCVRGDGGDGIFSSYPGCRQKGSSKKPGVIECFNDRHKQGYDWFNFMNQKWEDHHGKTRVVKEGYEQNQLLIDLKMMPEELKEAFDEYIEEQKQRDHVPQVGIHFLRFANQYDLAALVKDPNSIVEMLNARVPD